MSNYRKHNQYRYLEPLLYDLRKRKVNLTDKALQSLALATFDAKRYEYKYLYESSILTGLIKSQSAVTHLFLNSGLDLAELISGIHSSSPDFKQYSHKKDTTLENLREKPYRNFFVGEDCYCEPVFLDIQNLNSGELSSFNLFLSILDRPIIWRHLKSEGVSINKIKRHIQLLQNIEPNIEEQKFVLSYDGLRYHLDVYDFIDAHSVPFDENDIERGFVSCKTNLITPKHVLLQEQLEEFEWIINRFDVSEYEIQSFMEKHPDFLLGIEYKKLYSQLVLTREGLNDLRPDFFIEKLTGFFCDIVELKLPNVPLMVGGPNRRTFSANVTAALGQLKQYRKYFEDTTNREVFYKRYGLHAYKPQIYVVIGRSSSFTSVPERVDIEEEFTNLQLITYDDLVGRVKQRLKLLSY